ncbi:hypothetical protein [Corallococcus terminator]|uniref:Uncharacterized protein n=1 Tax=Corallococcus terminator TaxID=2316733 RepID=A0A3A8IF58_9BACT|nr:hypothetical protein [Corallococcus terminator]RKG82002.1 hypothetical protein D7V88_25780 [Corallococcus terminator]
MKLKFAFAAALGISFMGGLVATKAEAGPPCDYCIQLRIRCMNTATTPAQMDACDDRYYKCRDDICEAGH